MWPFSRKRKGKHKIIPASKKESNILNELFDERKKYESDPQYPADRLLILLSKCRYWEVFGIEKVFEVLVQKKELRVIPILVDALSERDGRSVLRVPSFEAQGWLVQLAPDSLPYLIDALADVDEKVRLWAAMTLGGIRYEPAVPLLLDGLEKELRLVRSPLDFRSYQGWAAFAFGWALSELAVVKAIPLLTRFWSIGIQLKYSRVWGHTMTLYEGREDISAYFIAKILHDSTICDELEESQVSLPDELSKIVNTYIAKLEADPTFIHHDLEYFEKIYANKKRLIRA